MIKVYEIQPRAQAQWKRSFGNFFRFKPWQDRRKEILLPSTWQEITVNQFMQLRKATESQNSALEYIISIFTGYTTKEIQSLSNGLKNALAKRLEFLQDAEYLTSPGQELESLEASKATERLLFSEYGRFLTCLEELKETEIADFGTFLTVYTIYEIPSPFTYGQNTYRRFLNEYERILKLPITAVYQPAIALTEAVLAQAKDLNEIEPPPPTPQQIQAGIGEFEKFGEFGLLYNLANQDLTKIPAIYQANFETVAKARAYGNKQAWFSHTLNEISKRK